MCALLGGFVERLIGSGSGYGVGDRTGRGWSDMVAYSIRTRVEYKGIMVVPMYAPCSSHYSVSHVKVG